MVRRYVIDTYVLWHHLLRRDRKKAEFSRRRRHNDNDISYINDRNAHFNKKIERAFGELSARCWMSNWYGGRKIERCVGDQT